MSLLHNKWFFRSIGFVLFILILSSVDIPSLVEIIHSADIFLIFLAIALIFPQIIMRAFRWQLLMKMQSIYYPLRDATTVYFAGLFVGTITPGRLGDFIKVQYLRDAGYSFGRSLLSVLIDRIYDLFSLLLVGYISMFVFIHLFSSEVLVFSTILLIIPVSGVFLFATGRIDLEQAMHLFVLFTPKKYRIHTETALRDFTGDLQSFTIGPLIMAAFITTIIWTLYFIMAYLFALSLHIAIPFLYLTACVSISAFITLIPISISGIGTREATFITLFSLIGIGNESAVAFSMMILLMYIINACVGFVAWQKKPIDVKQQDSFDGEESDSSHHGIV
jgi:uncharacterized protein (TIRG00374 family)